MCVLYVYIYNSIYSLICDSLYLNDESTSDRRNLGSVLKMTPGPLVPFHNWKMSNGVLSMVSYGLIGIIIG